MQDLTPKQIAKLRKIATVIDKGNLAIAEYLLELEEKMDEEIPQIKDIISRLKGDRGDTPTKDELLALIKPLIPEVKDGKDYILTKTDKKDIAKSIEVPVVEKVIERTEVIREIPFVTKQVFETKIENDDTGEQIVDKINSQRLLISSDRVEGLGTLKSRIAGWGAHPLRVEAEGSMKTKVARTLNFIGATIDQTPSGVTNVTVTGGTTDHNALTNLTTGDVHTQYAFLGGRSGGQTIIGGTGTTDDLILRTTSGVGATGADMIFQGGNNGATEFARFLNSGFFGIGTNAPARKFHIVDTINNYQIRTGSTGVFNYDMGRNGSNGLLYFYGNQTGAVGYVFDGVNGESMRIDTSRRLGIGTGATVAARVEINTVTAATIGLIVQGAASQTANLQEWQDSAGNILASVNQLGVISSTTDIMSSGVISGLSGYFYDGANVTTYLALSGTGLDTANGNVGAQIAGSGFAGRFYDVSNSLFVCDGTYAINATGISYLNGAIQTPAMPTADPADGQGTLWYDTGTNQVYRGT